MSQNNMHPKTDGADSTEATKPWNAIQLCCLSGYRWAGMIDFFQLRSITRDLDQTIFGGFSKQMSWKTNLGKWH